MNASRRHLAVWSALVIGGGLQLRYDVLRVLTANYKANFQRDSDALIWVTLDDPKRGVLDPLLWPTGEDYTSQFGLHGMVMALLSPGQSLYPVYRLVAAVLLAAVLATAVVACWRAWGGAAATVLGALLFTSPWLNAFGPSPYWQLWTFLLPMLVTLLVWPRLGTGRRRWVRGAPLIAGLVFLRCLCGYEFVSTVVLGIGAVVAFCEFRDRFDRRLFARVAGATAAAVGGFLAAVTVHATQLLARYGDVSLLAGRAGDRTLWPTELDLIAPRVYEQAGGVGRWLLGQNEVLGVWLFRMHHFFADGAVALPAPRFLGLGPLPFEIPVQVFIVVYAVLAWRAFRGRGADAAVQRRLAVAAGVGLVGALSWMVLALGHMIVHPHIDAIVFYLPFLPLVFAMVALRVSTAWRTRAPRGTQPAVSATDLPELPELEDLYAMDRTAVDRIPAGTGA